MESRSLEGSLLCEGVTMIVGAGESVRRCPGSGTSSFSCFVFPLSLLFLSSDASLDISCDSLEGGLDDLPDLVMYSSSSCGDEEAVLSYGVVHFPNRRVHC
jgi:hypothetical protein